MLFKQIFFLNASVKNSDRQGIFFYLKPILVYMQNDMPRSKEGKYYPNIRDLELLTSGEY